MRKSIFLLLILLISCSPVSTSTPTSTPFPPTATATPPLTETPTATPTPEGFQTGPDGAVQVYEKGHWVDLSTKVPDTIWGDRPEGASVVLKDGEALLRMELNNFQSPDGSAFADIAEYNPETKKWEVKPFSITRSTAEDVMFYQKNNNFIKVDTGERIQVFHSHVSILGFKVEENSEGNMSLQLMALYKGRVLVFQPGEISITVLESGEIKPKLLNPEKIDLRNALEVIRILKLDFGNGGSGFFLSFFATQNGVAVDNCIRLDFYNSQRLRDWCSGEVEKGASRKTLNKDNIDYMLLNQPNPITLEEDSDFSELPAFWEQALVPAIDGAFLDFSVTDKR